MERWIRNPVSRVALVAVAILIATRIARSQTRLLEFSSNRGAYAPDDFFGSAVSALGDVDGDGIADYLIAAQDQDNDMLGSIGYYGAIYVMSGADGHVIRHHNGSEAGGQFGFQAEGGVDFDGDGVPDYLASTPFLPFATEEGVAYVYSGATGAVLYSYSGERTNDWFGYVATILGDIDGDGVAEFAIGAEDYDDNSIVQTGRVYVYSGATGQLVYTVTGKSSDSSSERVCALGDLDADGIADFGIGSPGSGAGPHGEGTFDVYSGAGPTLLYTLTGEAYNDQFGARSTRIGDIDQDSVPDFAVSAITHSGASVNDGRVYVYSGAAGALLYSYDGTYYNEQFGRHLPKPGGMDVNHDGVPDILLGAPIRYVTGLYGGEVLAYSGRTGRLLYEFRGEFDKGISELLGAAIAAVGDVNVDGIDDILIGAPGSSRSHFHEGRAYVYTGNDLFLQANAKDYTRNDPITIDLRGGAPGAIAMLVVVDVTGTPMFVPIAIGALDANGEFELASTIPSGLRGNTFTFMGYAQKASGHGIADSIPETISIN